MPRGRFDVCEPSLLPETVEADALAAFCLWACEQLFQRPRGTNDSAIAMEILGLLKKAEMAIRVRVPLDDCYVSLEATG